MEDSEQVLIFSVGLGLTFDQIAKAIGRNEVWLAAAFYGQVRNFQKRTLPNIQFILCYRPNLLKKNSLKFLISWKSLRPNPLEHWESIGGQIVA